ncbi:MAG: CPBP family intramembrane metalloprotease [Saprospiraceae bacterium]|nr:CPBP family intramembrane metalloprotease [Saprospiraceae bacterium]
MNRITNDLDRAAAFRHLLIFALIVVASLLVGMLINQGVQWWLGDAGDPLSTPRLRLSLMILHSFSFLVPSIIFIILFYRIDPGYYLILDKPVTFQWLLVGVVMLFVSMPLIQYSYVINQMVPLPSWMTQMETETNTTIQRMLKMERPSILLMNLLLMAVLPAIGEELLFRGIIQKIGYKMLHNPSISVWLTALLFSAIHFQFEGFLPRFLLGLFLGYLFYWTKQLLLPMIVHFVNNATMVLAAYISPESMLAVDSSTIDMPIYVVFISLLLLIPLVLFFRNVQRQMETAS